MTTPNNGGAAKPEECNSCGRTDEDADFSEFADICDDCLDDLYSDPSWGAHEDAY